MKKIITTILSLSLLAGNAAIPVFAENESAEGVTEQIEVMAEDVIIAPTTEIEVPAENTGIEPTPEIEVPAEEVLQAEQPHETDEPVFDVPLFDEPVFPDAEKKPENDLDLFSSDFSLMASNGSCGENVTYTLDDVGTLTISGTGAMRDYSYNSSPFYYNTNIKTVIIESGVTSIGSYAFRGCSGITSITIPYSVTSIGSYAFDDCSGLTSITIPDSVTSIGNGAFDGCSGLTSVTIPDSITSIGAGAFSYCSGLTNIQIPDSVTSIDSSAFFRCSGITSITIPDSVTSIDSYAFDGCSGITSITIPDSVTSIGGRAFSGCSGLTTVNYNATYCAYMGGYMGSYNYSVFNGCNALTTVNIGNNVTNIPSYAFDGCSGLTSITIPESVTSIGYSAFSGCSGLTSITIPDSVTSIDGWAFFDCTGLTSVYVSDLAAYLNINFGSNPMEYASKLYVNNKRVAGDVVIPDTVTKIPEYAFHNCDGITSITIPNSVTSIGDEAFDGCSGLMTVNYNATNCTSMGSYNYPVFNGCNALTTVNIGDNVTNIPSSAFSGCSGLTSITIPDTVTSIGDEAFRGCSGLTSVTIPDTVTSIGNSAFRGCSGLTSITIPDTVTSIGKYAFSGCSGLTSVTIPDTVTSIGKYAFSGCSGLTSVYVSDLAAYLNINFYDGSSNPMAYASKLYVNDKRVAGDVVIPDTVTKIPEYAFHNCDGITSITIPDTVTSIGDEAFRGCSGLTSVTIPDTVTSIGKYAFSGCSNLEVFNYNAVNASVGEYVLDYDKKTPVIEVNIGSNVEALPNKLFNGLTSLMLVKLGDKVSSIGESTFAGCTNLKKLYIPKATTEIEKSAFSNCNSLSAVEYGGTESDWKTIYFGTGNDYLKNAKINYNSLPENAALTDLDFLTYTKNDDNTITITNCYQAASNIVIPATIEGLPVKTINASAFANNTKLISVTIPDSVTSIGERAFYGCSNLKNISIPNGITTIASNTFYNCSSLEAVSLPESVTTINGYAFYGCDKLSNVYYSGNKNKWNKINFNYGNDNLKNATVTYGKAPTYTITTSTQNGTITPDKTSAAMGEKVTFTVTPTSGYMLTDGSVKVNNGEVSVTSNRSSYSFTMPDKNVTITAAFEKIPPEMVTVLFDANEGTLTGASAVKVEKGTALSQSSIPTAAKDGYTFAGWLLNGKTFSLNTSITENITLTALWLDNGIQKTAVSTLSKFNNIMDFERSAGANGGAIFTVTKKGSAKVPQPVVFVAHFGTDGTLQSADKFDFTKNGDTFTAIVNKQTGNYKLFIWTDDAASMLEPITAPLTAADGVFE